MPKIASKLELNRVQELDYLLTQLKPLILNHISNASNPESRVGPRISPLELTKLVKLDTPSKGSGKEGVYDLFDTVLKNSVVTWHPGFLDKLYASTNPIGVVSDLLLSLLNTNSHVYTVSPVLTLIEKKVSKSYANLFGFTGQYAGGLTFSGGSWSNITSLQIARSILFPQTKAEGNGNYKFALFASKHSHYSVEKAAILLGLGANNIFDVEVDAAGVLNVQDLENKIIESKEKGFTPLYINSTAGTTVFGSFDPFDEISAIAKKYGIWFHIDGSWGGNVVFSEKYKHKLKGAEKADSITANPHKLLGVPTTCSFLLLPDERVFQTANSLDAPYLFHSAESDDTFYDLADGTMGCGRRPDALKLYLGWNFYGKEGYEERINHAYEITGYFADKLQNNPSKFKLVSTNPPPCMQVCFYFNKDGKFDDKEQNSKITREIVAKLHESGKFLIDFAPAHGVDTGEFFRVVFVSPIVNSDIVDDLYSTIIEVGENL
ncbi:Glutamate decarboxylase [Wickerhamomyces ciferrii]|uniref:Glutamate decarboxylase n=1 Tax=Wickerhamomyces ciferrii (strain ATCC 14091 / BCRC 22168 / CBS 111 / JCM 3599 / NBRC 0793 / NRRL Y-1031 F-60-10) TaxID=1206466 RepID=K0KN26_WICCF|nr:Glutamate decarboxylase [Wickerhamomyces ciferrii]CCH42533.1 Glutamate decarboxylase [Wickerhamomyces ciferrii]